MEKLTTMKNIGIEMEKKLHSININSAEELREMGSQEAYLRLKEKYSNLCLVHLYTLHGAIEEIDFNLLSEEVKYDLKKFNDGLKNKY